MSQVRITSEPTLDQRRARHAWDAVGRVKEQLKAQCGKNAANYAGEAKKLPARIMAAGLGQALAFLNAKQAKKPGLDQLLGDLTTWVIRDRRPGK